jgi:hypothetical protein
MIQRVGYMDLINKELVNEKKLKDSIAWTKHDASKSMRWTRSIMAITCIGEIKGWCPLDLFLYYSMEHSKSSSIF